MNNDKRKTVLLFLSALLEEMSTLWTSKHIICIIKSLKLKNMIQGRIICKFKRKISLQIRRKRSCDFSALQNRSYADIWWKIDLISSVNKNKPFFFFFKYVWQWETVTSERFTILIWLSFSKTKLELFLPI